MKEISEMTDKELMEEWETYNTLIHGSNPCYSCRDLSWFYEVDEELAKRGYQVKETIEKVE